MGGKCLFGDGNNDVVTVDPASFETSPNMNREELEEFREECGSGEKGH